jgi:RHS repeat-associated protein
VLERRTKSAREGNPTFEDVTFVYDALGHMTSMARYQDPANQANPVTSAWHFDSLGWMTKLEEPGVAPQIRTFDSWGEITQVQWCDDLSVAPCPTQDRRSIAQFDALGRVTHREDQTNGTVNPETVNDYSYDVGVDNATPPLTATNVLGRLARATSPTSTVSFSYDPFGRVNAQVFTDTTVTPNKNYVEQHDIHGDGSEQALHLLLADNAFKDERIDYDYDTAGRTKSVKYNDGTNQDLFTASGGTAIYDVFGRITTAQYGLATFNATYAASGRRLLNDVKVTSGDLAHSREIAFPALNDVTPYDPLGRERQRRELQDGTGTVALLRGYDEIGQLSASQNLQIGTNTVQPDRSFSFDPLGNVLTQTDSSTGNPGSVSLAYQAPDLDRIFSVAYGAAAPGNLTYDGARNILTEPTRDGTRTLTYFPNGQVKTIASGGTNATYAYDAFGAVQQLTLNTPSADMRQDKYFGGLVKQRTEGAASVVTRQIPAPGLVATRHGPTGGWTFAFGEPRGTRFATDQSGAFVQDIDYQPFGEVKNPTGAQPGTTNYTSEQWNGGDLLAALGVVQLGARIYDPVIGRFLSRDPIISAKSPYAFAGNDPINKSDPTGLCPPEQPCSDGVPPPPTDQPEVPVPSCTNDCAPSSLERGIGDSVNTIPGGLGYPTLAEGVHAQMNQAAAYIDSEEARAKANGFVAPTFDRNNGTAVNDGLGPARYIDRGAAIAEALGDCADGRGCLGVLASVLPAPNDLHIPPIDGDSLNDYSANATGGGRYIFAGSGNIYWSNAYDTVLFGINGTLTPNGELSFEVQRGPGSPIGRTMFADMIDAFGVNNVEAIHAKWSMFPPMSTNFRMYKAAIAAGAHPIYAAQLTWTGQRAWDLGFRTVTIEKETSILVRAVFRRH